MVWEEGRPSWKAVTDERKKIGKDGRKGKWKEGGLGGGAVVVAVMVVVVAVT